MTNGNIIEIKDVRTYLGGTWIHDGINLSIRRSEVLGIIGASGGGKTMLLREILDLTKPTSGTIKVFDKVLSEATPNELLKIQRRWGVLFQSSALFSSITLGENVAFPLKEHTHLDKKTIQDLTLLKLKMVGLSPEDANKYPAELSGGMQKRAGLARAIVLDPELLCLDEPTAGLDPNIAEELDQLVLNLQSAMGLTIVIVTHDIDSLWRVTDRVAFLGNGKILSVAPIAELVKNPDPLIQAFFNGPRGRAASASYQTGAPSHGN